MMPIATKEQVREWASSTLFDTDGMDAFVYVTDGMLAARIKATGRIPKTLDEALADEIRDCGMDPESFAKLDGGKLAVRGDTAPVFIACRKGPDWDEATQRRVDRLLGLLRDTVTVGG